MKKPGLIQIYYSPASSRTQRWRWKVTAANGRIVADSAEGYAQRIKCVQAVCKLRKAFAQYQILVKKK